MDLEESLRKWEEFGLNGTVELQELYIGDLLISKGSTQFGIAAAFNDVINERKSMTEGPIQVCWIREENKFLVTDGLHRLVEGLLEGRTHYLSEIDWTGYSLAWAVPEGDDRFSLEEVMSKLTKKRLQEIIKEELQDLLGEGNKASKTVGDPPYRERGSTESQAQQKAAGMALSARRGDTPMSKLKGAALDLYNGEITTKELRNLAKLGQKVKQHKSKEPKHLKSLPGHVTPAED